MEYHYSHYYAEQISLLNNRKENTILITIK